MPDSRGLADPGTADPQCAARTCHAPATDGRLSGDEFAPPTSLATLLGGPRPPAAPKPAAAAAPPPPRPARQVTAPSGTPEAVAQAWVAAGGRPDDIDRSLAPPDPAPASASPEQRSAAEALRVVELRAAPRTEAERLKGIAMQQGAPLAAVERPLTNFEVLLRTQPEVPLPNPRLGTTAKVPTRDLAPIVDHNGETVGYGGATKGGDVWLITDVHGRALESGTTGITVSDVQLDDIVFIAWSATKLATAGVGAVTRAAARGLPRTVRQLRNVAAAVQIGTAETALGGSAGLPVAGLVQRAGRTAVPAAAARAAPRAGVARARAGDPVRAFQASHPKLDTSPASTSALNELFRRTASGGTTRSPRAGRFVPLQTRGAAPELKTIAELSARPEVERIVLLPSSSAGRTSDLLMVLRQPGATAISRGEIVTVVGARAGYLPRGAAGARPTTVDDIVRAVRGKVRSTPSRPSQLNSTVAGVPPGGTLFVHLPRAGPQAVADVTAAWQRLAPELAGTGHVHAVEFFLLGRPPMRFVRVGPQAFELVSP